MIDEENLLGLNDFWNITTSQKLKRSDYIVNMVIEKIDNNQYIKRFMRYNSDNPLMKKYIKDDKTILQPNLKNSLTIDTNEIKDINKKPTLNRRCLYRWGFNSKIETNEQNYIFVENHQITFNNINKMATMFLNISIIIPDVYLELKDNESDFKITRNRIIAHTIDNMLDEYTVDNEFSEQLGNIKFQLTDYSESRLSRDSNKIISTLVYKCSYYCDRVTNYD